MVISESRCRALVYLLYDSFDAVGLNIIRKWKKCSMSNPRAGNTSTQEAPSIRFSCQHDLAHSSDSVLEKGRLCKESTNPLGSGEGSGQRSEKWKHFCLLVAHHLGRAIAVLGSGLWVLDFRAHDLMNLRNGMLVGLVFSIESLSHGHAELNFVLGDGYAILSHYQPLKML